MLFPMKHTDLHHHPVWTELRDFHMEQRVCYFGKPESKSACRQRRILDVRSGSNLLRQGKCLAGADSRTSSLTGRTGGGSYPRTQRHSDCKCTGTSRLGSTRMPRKNSGRHQRQRTCPGILTTSTRFGESTAQEQQQTRKRLLTKTKPANSQISNNMFASSNTETPPETEPG